MIFFVFKLVKYQQKLRENKIVLQIKLQKFQNKRSRKTATEVLYFNDWFWQITFSKQMRVPGCPLIIEVSEGSGSGARVALPGPVPLHQPASLTLHHPTATLDQIEVNVEGMFR